MQNTSIALLIASGMLFGVGLITPAGAADSCNAIGAAKFTCVSGNAEDLVVIPGTDWLVISGVLRAVNVKDHSEVTLFTTESRQDKKLYASCPGPITGKEIEEKKLHAHGINVRQGQNGLHTLYVVHHGERETIEVFEIDARGNAPKSVWVGCVPAPADVSFNGLAFLPDNGLAVTSFTRRSMGGFRGEKGKATRERLTKGENVSEIWEWAPGKEWAIIPGTEGAGLNGVEASKDGKYLYASAWATGDIIRYSRGQTPPEKKVIAKVDFHPDNIRWQPDGTLVTAGQVGSVDEVLEECLANQRCTKTSSSAAIIDPNSGKVRQVVTRYPSNGDFDLATAALVANNELWVGSIGRGARIGRFPLQ